MAEKKKSAFGGVMAGMAAAMLVFSPLQIGVCGWVCACVHALVLYVEVRCIRAVNMKLTSGLCLK